MQVMQIGCARCLARIAELEEEVRQLKEALAPVIYFPPEWKLLRGERDILSGMLQQEVFRSSQYRYFRLREREERDDIRNLSVRIWHIRRKLRPYVQVEIRSVWGIGYMLPEKDKRKLWDAINGRKE